MSLRFGPEIRALPGPSVIPLEVLRAMHRPAPNIYGGEIADITYSIIPDLKRVADTKGDVAIYIANGHGAWEASLNNILNRGDKVLVLKTGMFAGHWGTLATSLGIEVEELDFGMQSMCDVSKVEERLLSDKQKEIKAVLIVQTDTASSVKNDIESLGKMLKRSGHPALFCVDCIASLACDEFHMDDWNCDVVVAGCQKGLMTPVGLSFVYFSERAKEARGRASPSYYWDWVARTKPDDFYQYFGGTAPSQHIYGLRKALDMILHEEGLENVWHRHRIVAKAVWSALAKWNVDGGLSPNIQSESDRTIAVTALSTSTGDAAKMRDWCEQEAGVTLGVGIGFGDPGSDGWHSHFRIGHMGHNNIHMVMGVLGAIDSSLKALDIPHGEGALDAASTILSRSSQ